MFTEEERRHAFPVCEKEVFLAHAAVCPLPRVAAEAIAAHAFAAARGNQELAARETVSKTRERAAQLLGTRADLVSFVGPTSVGLSLVARGLPWAPGDEVVYYPEDYPANVYPWRALEPLGVKPVALHPELPGVITWDVVEAALTERTRLVALASCHFLSGYRIDVEHIGKHLQKRRILFCLDAIQSLGAFPMKVDHLDFLCADSHKWLLGPCGAGLFYASERGRALLEPILAGAGNVESPEFIAQDTLEYAQGGNRYEPGVLSLPGIIGMGASLELLQEIGVEAIGLQVLQLRAALLTRLRELGYRLYLEEWDTGPDGKDTHRSGIVSVHRPGTDLETLFQRLQEAGVAVSLRMNRHGLRLLRFSPHFYNTEEEIERVAGML